MKTIFALLALICVSFITSTAMADTKPKQDWYCFDIDPDGEDAETSQTSNVCVESLTSCYSTRSEYFKSYPFSDVGKCEKAERAWTFTFYKWEKDVKKYVTYTRATKNEETCKQDRKYYKKLFEAKSVSHCSVSG
jgi:hypothetical protein